MIRSTITKQHYQNPEILAYRIDAAEKAERKARKEEEAKTSFQPIHGDVREDQKSKGPTNAQMMGRIERATQGDTEEGRLQERRELLASEAKHMDEIVAARVKASEQQIEQILAELD